MFIKFLICLQIILSCSVFSTIISAACNKDEVGVGYTSLCVYGHCWSRDQWVGAIFSSKCRVLDFTRYGGYCGNLWNPLTTSVVCKNGAPIFVETGTAFWGNCHPARDSDNAFGCVRADKHRVHDSHVIQWCCQRLTNTRYGGSQPSIHSEDIQQDQAISDIVVPDLQYQTRSTETNEDLDSLGALKENSLVDT